MNVHDRLSATLDRLDPPGPDVPRLRSVARARGTRIRRRRTAAVSLVGALAIATGGAGVLAMVSGADDDAGIAADRVDAVPPRSPDLDGPTEPTTGPGAAVALSWAVAEQRQGAASELAGQLSSTSGDYYVELDWTDADDLGAATIGVNVQHGRGMHLRCDTTDDTISQCRESVLDDGSRLTTYVEQAPSVDGGNRRVADLFRKDRIRVVVSASSGYADADGDLRVTREAPPLTFADLTTVVTRPVWGDTLPRDFVRAGTELDDYIDIDAHGGWVRDPLG
jgi:hypothetical protein